MRRIVVFVAAITLVWMLAAVALDTYGRGRITRGHYDAIIVGGARVRHGGAPSGSLERRAERAAELFKQGVAPRLVLTGGVVGDRPSEASVAAGLVRERGVPESALLLEERSSTTEENARFTRELLGARHVLVVTDAYHVLRAQLVYERYFRQVDVIGVSNRLWPQGRHALREVAAVVAFAAIDAFHRLSSSGSSTSGTLSANHG